MKTFVAVTDNEWFRLLRDRAPLPEVNFWRPGPSGNFRALSPGEPLLFKLHSPENYVVGGGFFSHFSGSVPLSLAWAAFGEKNGVTTHDQMRRQIEKYRRIPPNPRKDYRIGCVLLSEPFFFEERNWIAIPQDWSLNIVQGKGYDTTTGEGARVWKEVQLRLQAQGPLGQGVAESSMFGEPYLVRPRLGQASFRILVTDTYERRCAVTGEKALPVLDAAHIQSVQAGGQHHLSNGLLLRSDVHRLFDTGYVTVTSDYRFRVSRRLKDDFDNGEPYYPFDRQQIFLPRSVRDRPDPLLLERHADTVFRG